MAKIGNQHPVLCAFAVKSHVKVKENKKNDKMLEDGISADCLLLTCGRALDKLSNWQSTHVFKPTHIRLDCDN